MDRWCHPHVGYNCLETDGTKIWARHRAKPRKFGRHGRKFGWTRDRRDWST
ncbi:hypothetical protein BDA96_04G318200 [Sorghum bicolor]|uniref:Uncharacterized protein n=1 Tax=Sorghum bicolor TaxID=4558 RepID=A0A921UJX4_SORBI|nr:hypothetical protein BDA96_04G318200 [Sorghum bicolor]